MCHECVCVGVLEEYIFFFKKNQRSQSEGQTKIRFHTRKQTQKKEEVPKSQRADETKREDRHKSKQKIFLYFKMFTPLLLSHFIIVFVIVYDFFTIQPDDRFQVMMKQT